MGATLRIYMNSVYRQYIQEINIVFFKYERISIKESIIEMSIKSEYITLLLNILFKRYVLSIYHSPNKEIWSYIITFGKTISIG